MYRGRRPNVLAATQGTRLAADLDVLVRITQRGAPPPPPCDPGHLLISASENALALVIKVGAVAGALKVCQEEGRPPVLYPPAPALRNVLRVYNQLVSRTSRVHGAAVYGRSDEVAHHLQGQDIFPVVPDKLF